MGRKKIILDPDKLTNSYKQLLSINKVALELNTTPFIVRERLIELGVRLVNPGGQHKYSCNDDFFSTDTPESFYWAGYMAADGCVSQSYRNGKVVSVSSIDIEHMEKFKKCVEYDGPVRIDTNLNEINKTKTIKSTKPFSGIGIHSEKMFYNLARFGVIPNKSLIYVFPDWLKQHALVNHFIRGCTDGDGCWSELKPRGGGRTRDILTYHLCGTNSMVESVREVFSKNCGRKITQKIYKNKNIFCLSYCGNVQAKAIRDFLYAGANQNIWLNRKHNIVYNDWIDVLSEYAMVSVIGTNAKTNEIVEFNGMMEAERHGFNHCGISECCSGKRKLHHGYSWKFNKRSCV